MKEFQPYDRTREVNEEARDAGAALLVAGERAEARKKTLIYVNNRLEGNALSTITGMIERMPSLKMRRSLRSSDSSAA